MSRIDLNSGWSIRCEDLDWGPEMMPSVLEKKDGWLDACLPADVHMPLIENGTIKEPLEEDNSYASEWIEQKSWWFKKVFKLDRETIRSEVVELTFEALDAEADVFLNGVHLGHHKSAFYPFVSNIKHHLSEEENTLLVRLSTGVEYVNADELKVLEKRINTEADAGRGDRGDKRRVFVRKPQFTFGWDWGPRVATCGIVKDVWIEPHNKMTIRSVHAWTKSISKNAEIEFEINIENFHPFSTLDTDLTVDILFLNEKALSLKENVLLRSGENSIRLEADIVDAKLWWPNGMGDQPLYTIKVSAASENVEAQFPEFNLGIRTLALDQKKIGLDERSFAFVINGTPVFCKGGNWIPCDSIYARVTDAKYDELVRQAKDANFNMLRVWGGGLYERDVFYRKCDEYGIMIWHDFMFACGCYPDYFDWFRSEAEKEMEYQTVQLRNHASLVMWCGNNEIHWAFDEFWSDNKDYSSYGGELCYNYLAPSIVNKNCPQIPYWNSSPYGGAHPNGNNAGDRHHWFDCTMHSDIEKRVTPEEYDKISAKFISEYGYIGPCRKSSIEKYHGNQPLDRTGRIWQLHNNTFEKEMVASGIEKHYTDPGKLDMDGYLLYAGLCQGLMLGYSLEAIRFKENCWGALFWMYNDCWGEVGWTIIDYYLKRKLSYYFVKRAFAPLRIIMREEQGNIRVIGINESKDGVKTSLEYGYLSFDGRHKECQVKAIEMAPRSRRMLFEFKKGSKDTTNGVYFSRSLDYELLLPAILNKGRFKEWNIPKPTFTINDFINEGDSVKFTLTSKTYAHAVHFNLDDSIELSDEFFDLLPGESREISAFHLAGPLMVEDIVPKSVVF